jgi:hypothetical protein
MVNTLDVLTANVRPLIDEATRKAEVDMTLSIIPRPALLKMIAHRLTYR